MDVWDSRSYKNSSTESIVNIIDNVFRLINFIWNGEHFPKKKLIQLWAPKVLRFMPLFLMGVMRRGTL